MTVVSQIMFVNGSLVMEAIFGKDVSVGTFVFLLCIMVPILLYSACLLMQESSGSETADSVSVAALFPMHCGWQN